jgi:hypothetical protein
MQHGLVVKIMLFLMLFLQADDCVEEFENFLYSQIFHDHDKSINPETSENFDLAEDPKKSNSVRYFQTNEDNSSNKRTVR